MMEQRFASEIFKYIIEAHLNVNLEQVSKNSATGTSKQNQT